MEEDKKEIAKAKDCLRELIQIIKTDGKLNVPNDEIFFLRFIRAKKYSATTSYKTLKQYYESRLKYPKSFEKFYPSALRHVLDSGVVTLLKHRDQLGRKTFVFRFDKWDPDLLTFEDITMACLLIAEQMSWCPQNQVAGAVTIVDETGLKLGHARQVNLSAVHKLVFLLQDCFPGRYKAAHLVNQPYVLDLICNLAKRFISKKLVTRIKIHPSYESLHEHVNPDILPESMGGLLPDSEAFDDEILPQMINNDNYYKELLKYGFK